MKKALINPIDLIEGFPSVVSVSDTECPCVPDYYWVNCPDDTQSGMYYKDGEFFTYTPPPPPIPIPTAQENKEKAIRKLTKTDWVEFSSVTDPSSTPRLLNKDEFVAFRNSVRAIAVNPVDGLIDFPPYPTEQWSN
jgi:hypothetical protein